AAARADYEPFDLTRSTPLLTTKEKDESKRKWDRDDSTGLRSEKSVKDVEYWRDVRSIFERNCVACHTPKAGKPAGGLVLDDGRPVDSRSRMGPKNAPPSYAILAAGEGFGGASASRYVQTFQSRSSLLISKLFGKRMDGRKDGDIPSPKPGGK